MFDFLLSANRALLIVIAVLVLGPLLYVGGGQFMGTVNNRPLAVQPQPGESAIVTATARMIEREVDSGFCPSAYFWPGHIRFDVCGFQEGEQQILQRVVLELTDHLTREGPTSERNASLNAMLADVNRPNTYSLIFHSNNTASLLGSAVKHLDDYSAQLKNKQAGFYPRIDNLALLISDLTNVLGSEAQHLQEVAAQTGIYSMKGRAAYFHTLGTMAASCWVLQAAQLDFDEVLKLQSAEAIFAQAMQNTCSKIDKDPAIVFNGEDLSHLLSLAGAASAAVNNLASLQNALAAAPHNLSR